MAPVTALPRAQFAVYAETANQVRRQAQEAEIDRQCSAVEQIRTTLQAAQQRLMPFQARALVARVTPRITHQ